MTAGSSWGCTSARPTRCKMVGPPTPEQRAASSRRLKASIVALVGGSAGLIALQGGASLVVVLIAALAGLVLGVLLVWYLVQISP